MTPVRLTKTGRAGLKAVLDADQLDRHDTGLRAPGWNAVVDLPDEWVEPVKPPLPAEPEPGPYLIGEFFAIRRAGSTAPERWLSISLVEGGHRWSTWDSLAEEAGCPDVPVRRAVPAPDPDDDKPSAEDWTEGRKAARIHGFAGGTEVNSVSFTAGFAAGFRKGRRVSTRKPEPVDLPANMHDVVASAIARAEKEPVVSGHYALAECVVEELRVRGWLTAADQAEGTKP